jgi:hypothetical protein
MDMGADHQGPLRCSLARGKLLVVGCVGDRDDKRDVKTESSLSMSNLTGIRSSRRQRSDPVYFPGPIWLPQDRFTG